MTELIQSTYQDRVNLTRMRDLQFLTDAKPSVIGRLVSWGNAVMAALLLVTCTVPLAHAVVEPSPAPQVLRAVVSETNPVPYAMFSADGVLMGGISKNLIDKIGQLNRLSVSYLDVPRARVEGWLINNQADVGCFLSPDWVSRPQALIWVGPLFHSAQLVVRRSDSKPILQLSDMYYKRVGTIRGFVYPELEQAFAEKLMTRDDAHSLESNLTRLAQGRLDAVMTVDLSLGYVLSKRQFETKLSFDPLWTPAPAIYCAISPDSKVKSALLQSFAQLQTDGYIQQLLVQYQPTGSEAASADNKEQ